MSCAESALAWFLGHGRLWLQLEKDTSLEQVMVQKKVIKKREYNNEMVQAATNNEFYHSFVSLQDQCQLLWPT